jgi:repressor LexA
MITGLTRKQTDLFQFIAAYTDRHGIAPTLEEMTVAIDLKSKSGTHRLLTCLEERGWIRREKGLARALIIEDAAQARLRQAGAA